MDSLIIRIHEVFLILFFLFGKFVFEIWKVTKFGYVFVRRFHSIRLENFSGNELTISHFQIYRKSEKIQM